MLSEFTSRCTKKFEHISSLKMPNKINCQKSYKFSKVSLFSLKIQYFLHFKVTYHLNLYRKSFSISLYTTNEIHLHQKTTRNWMRRRCRCHKLEKGWLIRHQLLLSCRFLPYRRLHQDSIQIEINHRKIRWTEVNWFPKCFFFILNSLLTNFSQLLFDSKSSNELLNFYS